MSYIKTLSTIGILIALTVGATQVIAAKQKPVDLSGTWTNASLTGLTRKAGVDKLIVSKAEAEKIVAGTSIAGLSPEEADTGKVTDPNEGAPEKGGSDFGLRGYDSFWTDPGSSLAVVKGEYRSSFIVDPKNGQIPKLKNPKVVYKDQGFRARYVTGIGGNSDPEALPIGERCLIGFGNTGGPGMQGTLYNSNYQFVHTDDYLMILVEMVHDARIIPLFDSAKKAKANHRPNALKPWLGDSVGWYEGKTLVVETINFNALSMEQNSTPISPTGKLIERFERYSDKEIFYQFTIEDSNLYSQPWTAELSFYETEGPVYEYACHEGNYAMPGILEGARLKEREAAAKK
ncbi:MAG: hypothetical protein K6L75_06310 [Cellvibrionaceae bacterium]